MPATLANNSTSTPPALVHQGAPPAEPTNKYETQTRAHSSNPEYLQVRTPASLFNTDFEGCQSAPTSAGDAQPVSTTRVRPDRGMNLFNGTPWAVQVTVGAITVTAQARAPRTDTTRKGVGTSTWPPMGTSIWPSLGTYSWPKTGTFTWPRTYRTLFLQELLQCGVLCQSFVTNVGPSDRLSQNIYASDQACADGGVRSAWAVVHGSRFLPALSTCMRVGQLLCLAAAPNIVQA